MIPPIRPALVALTSILTAATLTAAPTHLVDEHPVAITRIDADTWLVDFGRVSFGNLRLETPADLKGDVRLHLGEAFKNGRIDREPPGTVRYYDVPVSLTGDSPLVAAPPPDPRNTGQTHFQLTHPPAILTPEEWGVIAPFRWVEVEVWPGDLKSEYFVRQSAFSSVWDDDAASFSSSDDTLNRIWDLCRYSIKATTFAGVYVDGDRERIPYEADAYLNQLSHYGTDTDIQTARDTIDHLIKHGTWPTEWPPHMIMMVHADWIRTGDADWSAGRYEALKPLLLTARVGEDGLVQSTAAHIKRGDIVDWPKTERDGFVFTSANTVVNAFHVHTLRLMGELATAIGKPAEAADYFEQAESTLAVFNRTFFDAERGVYRDGIGTDHASLHANLFPLAFGLVPDADRAGVTDYLIYKGMACSVYAAQYLLEALYYNDAGDAAMDLILADNDRSWRHMVNSGTTISWEAWDQKYKPNQDWNHAWGAAPANLIPRFVLGVEPAVAGAKELIIRPHPGPLEYAKGKIPTQQGPVGISWIQQAGRDAFTMSITLPAGVTAQVELPAVGPHQQVYLNNNPVSATRDGARWILDSPLTETVSHLEVK
ncbi:MAG: hypothetical protein SynsKO_39620 [Synoicihabitans sp.]